jgi:hypothetical protein
MRIVLSLFLVCVVALTAFSLYSAVAHGGICPNLSEHQRREIIQHYKQVFPGKTVEGDWQIVQHDPHAKYIVRIYDWPRLVYTVIIPVRNTCATSYNSHGVPQGWPVGVPYPQP